MTPSEKLLKIIERAVKNGWGAKKFKDWGFDFRQLRISIEKQEWKHGIDFEVRIGNKINNVIVSTYSQIIFSHDFAKAFFGGKKCKGEWGFCINCKCDKEESSYCWKNYHQQLVLTPPSERVDYLFSFIGDDTLL